MRYTRSECAACGVVFAGVRAFDAHRVGSYQSNTRHCLTASEMRAQGMTLDARGWWMLPELPQDCARGISN
jgi:hypothetical protein